MGIGGFVATRWRIAAFALPAAVPRSVFQRPEIDSCNLTAVNKKNGMTWNVGVIGKPLLALYLNEVRAQLSIACVSQIALTTVLQVNPEVNAYIVSTDSMGGNVLDTVDLLRERGRENAKIIVLCERSDERCIRGLAQAGCNAIVDGGDLLCAELANAFLHCQKSGVYVSPKIQREIDRVRGNATDLWLSPKEQLVLTVIGTGLDNEHAAICLRIAPETVRTHRERIMKKLSLCDKGSLVRYALQKGYVRVENGVIHHPGFESLLIRLANLGGESGVERPCRSCTIFHVERLPGTSG